MSPKPQRERAGARVVLVMLLVLALMLGVGYLAAYAAAQDKTPRGTTVGDVPVGGQTLPDAAATLRSGLASRAEASRVMASASKPGPARLASWTSANAVSGSAFCLAAGMSAKAAEFKATGADIYHGNKPEGGHDHH